MPQLTEHERLRLSASLDQEQMQLREFLDCPDYRHLLLEATNILIKGYARMMDQPDVTPQTVVEVKCNIVDMVNVLRMSQAYLCQEILRGNSDVP